jgi:hypothetical protein
VQQHIISRWSDGKPLRDNSGSRCPNKSSLCHNCLIFGAGKLEGLGARPQEVRPFGQGRRFDNRPYIRWWCIGTRSASRGNNGHQFCGERACCFNLDFGEGNPVFEVRLLRRLVQCRHVGVMHTLGLRVLIKRTMSLIDEISMFSFGAIISNHFAFGSDDVRFLGRCGSGCIWR